MPDVWRDFSKQILRSPSALLTAAARRRSLDQKHAIARRGASVIRPGENILLDAGSTVGALAPDLRGFEKLSFTTPGINTSRVQADSDGVEAWAVEPGGGP
jgi:DeoR/GlpR family transcriptional regulator of sugar metabolism